MNESPPILKYSAKPARHIYDPAMIAGGILSLLIRMAVVVFLAGFVYLEALGGWRTPGPVRFAGHFAPLVAAMLGIAAGFGFLNGFPQVIRMIRGLPPSPKVTRK